MALAVREKDMRVGLKAMKQVIQDYERYPEFLPEVVGAKILTEKNGQAEVQFDINLMKRFQYTLRFDNPAPNEITWTLVRSDFFKSNEGRWVLQEKGPLSTHARYELNVSFGFFVPSLITKTLTEVNLPSLLDRFEERARKIAH